MLIPTNRAITGLLVSPLQTSQTLPLKGALLQARPFWFFNYRLIMEPTNSVLFAETHLGLSLKFFRDGMPSSNFMAMYSLEGMKKKCNEFLAV